MYLSASFQTKSKLTSKFNAMADVFYPLQTLKIITDELNKKAYLVINNQCNLFQFQFMVYYTYGFDPLYPNKYKITLRVPQQAVSQTPLVWTGEHRVEIPFDPYDRPKSYTVITEVYKQTGGGVTNTINNDGSIPA